MDQFFIKVGLSNAKEKVKFANTRVAGSALEYWNHYESLHFRYQCLKLLGKKVFELNISHNIFTRIYSNLLMAIYKIKEQV